MTLFLIGFFTGLFTVLFLALLKWFWNLPMFTVSEKSLFDGTVGGYVKESISMFFNWIKQKINMIKLKRHMNNLDD